MVKFYNFDKRNKCYSLLIMQEKSCIADFYAQFTKDGNLSSLVYHFHSCAFVSPTVLLREFISAVDNFMLTGNVSPKDSSNSIFE